MGRRWRRGKDEAPADTAALERAQRSLERARAQHAEQARKREQEQEGVIKRFERLADGNHLAALMWDVITGDGGDR